MRPDAPRDPVAGPESGPSPPFPLKLSGKVIKGFGRGSKELGIPTANIPLSGLSVGGQEGMESGIYFGWAGLEAPRADGPDSREASSRSPASADERVHPMVMSVGWNPYYKNTVRSVEVHIMHSFPTDFYGSHLNLLVLGFIRPEYDYVSKEALVDDIKEDIEVTRRSLARPAYAKYRDDEYLVTFPKARSKEEQEKIDVAS
ncbi:riboflavin kinase [Coniosporium apollinis]|uniref:Riboflavin kinase n=1 Tax=Coniosporium apollinis TaxID=61459 RepID=A0ABQ9NYE1_9PEZI|nr:riboflavin kinase [Coniosporium apollinis]